MVRESVPTIAATSGSARAIRPSSIRSLAVARFAGSSPVESAMTMLGRS
jgi:hypothetical protein